MQTVSMRQVKLPSFMVVGITNDLSPLGMKGTWDQLYARMSEISCAVNPKVGYGLLIDRRYNACMTISRQEWTGSRFRRMITPCSRTRAS